MYDPDAVERLRELVVDERARRVYAEKQLLAERRRSQALRSKADERNRSPRKKRSRVRGLLRRIRRTRGQAVASRKEVISQPSSAPAPASLPPYHPTLRVAAWNAPDWLSRAAEVVDLAYDQNSLAGADMTFVSGTGALTCLSDWLTLPARQPLVLWDWGEGEADDWARYLTDRDLVVGSRPLGAAKHLDPWPVADPRDYSSDTPISRNPSAAVATAETPYREIVSRALMRSPMKWGGPQVPPELTGLIVGDSVDRRKAGVVSRLVAAERHSPAAAIELIADQVGIRLPTMMPTVGILLVTKWPDRLPKALEQISRLRYPHCDVVVGLHGTGPFDGARSGLFNLGIEDKVRFLEFDERLSLGECLNRSAEATGASVLAKFDDDDRYGPWYLDEAVDELTTTGAELVGKATQYVHLSQSDQLILYQPGKEHSEVGYVNGPTFVMPRHTWEQVRFPHRRSRVDSIFVRGLKAMGGTIWSTSRYEFVLGRQAEGHTWEASDERFLASSEVIGKGADDAEVWLAEI